MSVAEPLPPAAAPSRPEPAAVEGPVAETVIEARPGWRVLSLADLWKYRELLVFLAWRDVQVRYKQTALGAAWALLQPLTMMLVLTLFLARVPGVADRSATTRCSS